MIDRNASLRAFFARYVAAKSGAHDPRIEQAFAAVPREDFLPPPPWTVISGGVVGQTGDLAEIYTDVLVALDRRRGINNGEPMLHAAWLDTVDPRPSEAVIHVGAGTGYYTALLGVLVEPGGSVDAYEYEADLAAQAARNTADRPNIRVHAASAFGRPLPQADVIYVNAGVNAPDPEWLRALTPRGRLIFPWQPTRDWGTTILATPASRGFKALPSLRVGFIPCSGETTKPTVGQQAPRFSIDRTRSLWLADHREPDASATAVYDSVWFSADEAV